MSTPSRAYAELGGAVDGHPMPPRIRPRGRVWPSTTIDPNPGRVCDHHLFDPQSGWCGCGLRDDGQTAPGSPAWRAAIEHHLPDPQELTP